MNEQIHTPDSQPHSFLQALLGNRFGGATKEIAGKKASQRLAKGVRGVVFMGVGYLFGTCVLPLDTAPLGLALLCASSSYTWYILVGLMLSAFTYPVALSTPLWVGIYTFCILLRLAVMFFVDPPLLPGEEVQPGLIGTLRYVKRYLGLCLSSAGANMGLGHAPDTPEEDIRTEYYAGAAPSGEAQEPISAYAKSEGEPHAIPQRMDKQPPRYRPSCDAKLFREHPFLRTLTGAVTGFVAGVCGMIIGGFHFYDLFATLLMILVVPAVTMLLIPTFGEAGDTLLFSPRPLRAEPAPISEGQLHLISRFKLLPLLSLSALLFGVLYAARAFTPMLGTPYLTIRVATLIGLVATLSVSSRLGLLPALLISIVAGLGVGPSLLPIFILAAVTYAFLHILSHKVGILGGCAAGALWCATTGDLGVLLTQLPTLVLAAPLFFLVERLWERMPLSPVEKQMHLGDFSLAVAGETRITAQNQRLASLSEAFSSLSHRFLTLSDQLKHPRRQDLQQLCHEVLRERCATCRHRAQCWDDDARVTVDAEEQLTTQLCESGMADEAHLHSPLRERCPHLAQAVTEINTRMAQLTQTLVRSEKTEVFAADYAHMAELLSDAANENSEEYRCNRAAADKIYDCLSALGVSVQGVVVCGRRNCRVIVRGTRMDRLTGKTEEVRRQLESICGAHLDAPTFEEVGAGADASTDTYTVMMLASRPRVEAVYAGSTVPAGASSVERLSRPLTNETGEAGESRHTRDAGHTSTPETTPAVCGDHIAIFKNQQACFYALISDGMGSGDQASATSDICAVFLEKMLSAGNRVEISLQMLNSFLRAKNAGCGDECSATVDLLELDLVDGHAVFAKSGAAPTYVVRGGTVYKLRSRSLPLGILRESTPQLLRFRMHPGDVVVMVSDGVTLGNDECPWLIDLLSDPLPGSMDDLRLDILHRAIASGSPDDLSAIAIRVEPAE